MTLQLCWVATLSLFLSPVVLNADDNSLATLHFRSGGTLNGQVLSEPKENGRQYLLIRTESGSVLKIRKNMVTRVVVDGPDQQLYRAALAKTSDTPQDHWSMYQWCRENGGASKFGRQIDFHLKQIVKLDPSDAKAWQKLNYIMVDGSWVPEEQHFLSRGYVKHKGNWVPRLHLESDDQRSSAKTRLNARKKALKRWQNNTLHKKDIDTVRSELFRLVDEISARYFEDRFIRREADSDLRILYLEAIGRLKSNMAQQILVRYAVEDEDGEVREQALLLLEQEHYDPAFITRQLARYLDHPENRMVNRAGRIIGQIRNTAGIIPLIGALRTEHVVRTGSSPGQMNAGFDRSGGISFGTGGPETVTLTRENESVRQALSEITSQDFGFDSDSWKEWYVVNHTVMNYDVGRSGVTD